MMTRSDIAREFDLNAPALFGYLRHMGLAEADAGDVLQSAFLKLLGASPSELKSPRAWLYTVARRTAIDRFRKKTEILAGDDSVFELRDGQPDGLEALLREEENVALWQAFALLPANEQELLRLYILDELDYPELAVVLGKSEGALRVAVFRARGHLRKALSAATALAAESEASA